MLQVGESTIHRIFMGWVAFMKAIFSFLNLKTDDGFLPYVMPEGLSISERGLTVIIIA